MSAALRPEDIKILVLGDVNLDTFLVPLVEDGQWWRHRRRGGAWLLEEIIEMALKAIRTAAKDRGWRKAIEVKSYDHDAAGVDSIELKSAQDKQYWSAAAILGLFPMVVKDIPGAKDTVYRLEQWLGWAHYEKEHPKKPFERPLETYKQSLRKCLERLEQATQVAQEAKCSQDILVLHDAARDFRNLDPSLLRRGLEQQYKPDKTWIIWQMAAPLATPLANSELWQIIKNKETWLPRTILVVKVEYLRRVGLNMPDVISLEQECEIFDEFMQTSRDKSGSPLEMLTRLGHLVVHFRRQGVLYYNNGTRSLETSCYFCPDVTDDRGSRQLGTMLGFTSILVAAIVRGLTWELIHNRDISKGIITGIKQGVILDHLYFLHGYGERALLSQPGDPLPYERLFDNFTALHKSAWKDQWNDYRVAAIGRPKDGDSGTWSRIEYFINNQWQYADPSRTTWKDIHAYAEAIAQQIVRRGLDQVVLQTEDPPGEDSPETPPLKVHCPFEVHGKIKTAFRHEIDQFASIRLIIEKYLNDKNWQSPLSIAVFGPPGSGKSFTIQQIMHSVNAHSVKRLLKYNMAQFDDPEDLETVFHKVQDEAVAGEVPLVFFDEFDAENLTWLKYFLAPMQDGEFKAGDSTYRIGRAIFVFAGGISISWGKFYEERKDEHSFKAAKGTDFVSRLRGYLDIKTINNADDEDLDDRFDYSTVVFTTDTSMAGGVVAATAGRRSQSSSNSMKKAQGEHVLLFRRAVLLRSLLEHHLKGAFDKNMNEVRVDANVIHAFLKVKRYVHEARSMQAIIEMSRISLGGYFQESSLPARDQLRMHVDDEDFYDLLREPLVS